MAVLSPVEDMKTVFPISHAKYIDFQIKCIFLKFEAIKPAPLVVVVS